MSGLAVPKPTKRKRRKDAKPRCGKQRCKRRVFGVGLCLPHLREAALAIFSQDIRARDGRCIPAEYDGRKCAGGLQCAHLLPQGNYPEIRLDKRNAIAACAGHHTYYEHHRIEWMVLIDRMFGEGTWMGLRDEALNGNRDWREAAIELVVQSETEGGE